MALGPRSLLSMAQGTFDLRGESSKFVVQFDDSSYDLGAWSKVSGLGVKWDPIEYRTGNFSRAWSGPGVAKYSTISLSRATCFDSQAVQDWLAETTREPKVFSGAIKLLTPIGIALCEWTLEQFIPIGWKLADLDSKAATVVVETLELAHNGFLHDHFKTPKH